MFGYGKIKLVGRMNEHPVRWERNTHTQKEKEVKYFDVVNNNEKILLLARVNFVNSALYKGRVINFNVVINPTRSSRIKINP